MAASTVMELLRRGDVAELAALPVADEYACALVTAAVEDPAVRATALQSFCDRYLGAGDIEGEVVSALQPATASTLRTKVLAIVHAGADVDDACRALATSAISRLSTIDVQREKGNVWCDPILALAERSLDTRLSLALRESALATLAACPTFLRSRYALAVLPRYVPLMMLLLISRVPPLSMPEPVLPLTVLFVRVAVPLEL